MQSSSWAAVGSATHEIARALEPILHVSVILLRFFDDVVLNSDSIWDVDVGNSMQRLKETFIFLAKAAEVS